MFSVYWCGIAQFVWVWCLLVWFGLFDCCCMGWVFGFAAGFSDGGFEFLCILLISIRGVSLGL